MASCCVAPADTGGGVLHAPDDAVDLADKLAELLANPPEAERLGKAGQQAVHNRYNAQVMAEQTAELYRGLR